VGADEDKKQDITAELEEQVSKQWEIKEGKN